MAGILSRSDSSGKMSVASDEPRHFEMTAGLLKAKRVKDRAFAKEAYVGAAWILGPGPAVMAAIILILSNEIVYHTSSTECVRPLDVFVQGIIALSWILVLVFANQLIGPCGLRSFFQLQVLYTVWLVVFMVWIVLGVVFSAGSEPCLETAPVLYRMAVAQVVILFPLASLAILFEVEWCIRRRPFFASEARKAKTFDSSQADGDGGDGGGDEEGEAGEGGEGAKGSDDDSDSDGDGASGAEKASAEEDDDEDEDSDADAKAGGRGRRG